MATGSNTLLQSLYIILRNGNRMSAPKNRSNSAGVTKIPARLLMTALDKAVATFPPAADVKKMHMLTVVGRQLMMRIPSNKVDGSNDGMAFRRKVVTGNPMRRGHAPKVAAWMALFSFTLASASVSSDNSRDRPDMRKMNVTPNLPMNNSGCK